MKIGTLVRINHPSEAETQFCRLHDAGMEACQLVYKPKTYDEADAPVIRQAAEKYGIEISAQFCGYYDTDGAWDNYWGYQTSGIGVPAYRQSRIAYVREASRFAHALGVTDVIIHGGFIDNDPFSAQYLNMVGAVRQVAESLLPMQMNLLLETGAESSVALRRLIEDVATGNVFVNLDPANMLMYGYANPVDSLPLLAPFVRNMHGKDGLPPTDTRTLGKETVIGQGKVDFPALLKGLKEAGYDRFIIIERETTGEEQWRDVVEAKRFLEITWARI